MYYFEKKPEDWRRTNRRIIIFIMLTPLILFMPIYLLNPNLKDTILIDLMVTIFFSIGFYLTALNHKLDLINLKIENGKVFIKVCHRDNIIFEGYLDPDSHIISLGLAQVRPPYFSLIIKYRSTNKVIVKASDFAVGYVKNNEEVNKIYKEIESNAPKLLK